jgi:predicted Zn-dependent protease
VKGWAAYSDSHFDQSLAISNELLTASPTDPISIQLKARSLISLNQQADAADVLTKQVKAMPSDYGSFQLLARIYATQNDWAQVAQCAQHMASINPADPKALTLLVEAGLRSGNVAAARAASFKLLQPNANPQTISAVLDLWAQYWNSPERITDARQLGAAAQPQQRLVYAAFLNRVGSPGDAIRLVGSAATLPVNAGNAEANAVVGAALAHGGNVAGAKSRLDAVLAFDPGNATALRWRSELELRTGNTDAAIHDAQKLITVLPDSARDRLLLARAYSAAGQKDWADRTLWLAFQDIPADESIYAALRATRSGNADAMNEVQAEFDRQRKAQISRGLL